MKQNKGHDIQATNLVVHIHRFLPTYHDSTLI